MTLIKEKNTRKGHRQECRCHKRIEDTTQLIQKK
jgi:hypothetical protein